RLDDKGLRLVAAIDRSWLEFVVGAFGRRGIRVQAAWPAQLALPLGTGRIALACLHDGLALRTGVHDGIGWSAGADSQARVEAIACALSATGATVTSAEPAPSAGRVAVAASAPETAAGAATPDARSVAPASDSPAATREASVPRPAPAPDPLEVLDTPVPGTRRKVMAFVEDGSWQAPVLEAAARAGIDVDVHSLAFPVASPVDLLTARAGTSARRWLADVDWRAWRAPAVAMAASVVIALVGLNLHWAALAKESERLHAAIEQRYRDAFPGAQVI